MTFLKAGNFDVRIGNNLFKNTYYPVFYENEPVFEFERRGGEGSLLCTFTIRDERRSVVAIIKRNNIANYNVNKYLRISTPSRSSLISKVDNRIICDLILSSGARNAELEISCTTYTEDGFRLAFHPNRTRTGSGHRIATMTGTLRLEAPPDAMAMNLVGMALETRGVIAMPETVFAGFPVGLLITKSMDGRLFAMPVTNPTLYERFGIK